MKISLEAKEYIKDIFILSIDEEPWREIHVGIFGRRPELPSQTLSLEQWKEAFYLLEQQKAKLFAIKRLSYRSHHTTELVELLESRCVSSSLISQLIKEFTHLGYLNDEEWIKSFLRVQLSRKVGYRNIIMKLQRKKIPYEGLAELMQELDYSPILQIQKLLETKFRQRNLSDYKEKQKVIASLARKGFEFSDITQAFQRHASDI